MALFDGGGAGQSLFSGVQNIGKSVAKSAAPKKKKKSTGSGVKKTVNHGQSAVNSVGRSVARRAKSTSQPARRTQPSRNTYRNSAPRMQQPPRISVPRPPVGNTPSGTVARSVPPPAPPITPEQFLAKDTTFQSQQSAYQKAIADYAAQMQAEQGKYNGEYDASVKQLGLDRTEGMTGLKDDYASRGLLNSGVYGDALGDLTKKYDTQQADLERAKQAYMSDLTTGQTNFASTQQELLAKARQEALQRRLASLGG